MPDPVGVQVEVQLQVEEEAARFDVGEEKNEEAGLMKYATGPVD